MNRSVFIVMLHFAAIAGCGSEPAGIEAPDSASNSRPQPGERHEPRRSAADIVRVADLLEPTESPDQDLLRSSMDAQELYLQDQIQTARRRAEYDEEQEQAVIDAVNGRQSRGNPDLMQSLIKKRQGPPPEPDPSVYERLRERYHRQTGDPYDGLRAYP